MPWRIVILGLSITSSWGNGHATTYRALVRALAKRGHDVLFLERNVPWYAHHRDLPRSPYCRIGLYRSLADLKQRFARRIRSADVVIVGSYVPKGAAVGRWVTKIATGITAFYDIDTPVTLSKLARGEHEYLAPELIPHYHVYFSFTGGPTLQLLRRKYGSPMPRALYCSVDPKLYYPQQREPRYDLGYIGTYSPDRQPPLEELLIKPAQRWPDGRFVVAGPQYPRTIDWPDNVHRIEHLPPRRHRHFYNIQRFTLNITRADMKHAGWSPSVRLFEAAACATPIISDYWHGLDELFAIDREILIARSAREALQHLRDISEHKRLAIGRAALKRVLAEHTAEHRALELEQHIACALDVQARRHAAVLVNGHAAPRRRSPHARRASAAASPRAALRK